MTTLERAIIFATNAHAGSKRKGKEQAFILHPIEAMTIVGIFTDDEEVLAAAVLHDTVEDTNITLDDIKREFGKRVADLVAFETEDKRVDRPAESTWKIRKEETVKRLKHADRDVKLICLGDKLSNLREMCRDYDILKDDLWDRFNQKDKSLHCCYYASIYQILAVLSSPYGIAPLSDICVSSPVIRAIISSTDSGA